MLPTPFACQIPLQYTYTLYFFLVKAQHWLIVKNLFAIRGENGLALLHKRGTLISMVKFKRAFLQIIPILLLSTLLLSLGWQIGNAAEQNPAPHSAEHQNASVPLYSKFEKSFRVAGEYSNPYDIAQVDVNVTFVAPSGQSYQVPAFYMEPYQDICTGDCPSEVLEADGEGEWRVRFTPTELGNWRYTISSIVAGETNVIETSRFEVTENASAGFIRVSSNGHYFEFDDKTPYFPIGQNLGWSWEAGGGLYTYLEWLDKLAAAGVNFARINIDNPWFIGLEWTMPAGQYGGAGQAAAWRFDQILDAAAERGIYLQVTLIWHQAFRDYTGLPVTVPRLANRADISQDFDYHPYNTRLGGTISGPGDIFFNSQAQALLQQRLRYIVARWGYSPTIFAWEIVDSIDRMASFSAERDTAWLTRMIETVREVDANQHLITVGSRNYHAEIETNPNLDFNQTVFYQARPIEPTADQVTGTMRVLSESLALIGITRPILLSEFSINPWFEPTADDPTGVHIRNTLWASIFSGAGGSAMTWWWDTYVDPQNLYPLYTAISYFTQGIPWNTASLEPVQPGLVSDSKLEYESLRINDFNRQFRSASPPDTIFYVTADGASPPTTQMSSYLYGKQFNTANSRPQTLILTPPVDTTLTIGVRNVSSGASAKLLVTIDGITATSLDLSAGTGSTSITIPITAGRHVLVFDNPGDDWLQLDYLEIADYRAPLRSLALADLNKGIALAWIHNRSFTWEQVESDATIEAYDFDFELSGMPIGDYQVEFWDPATGNIIGDIQSNVAENSNGLLHLDLLPIRTELALRIFRISGPETQSTATLQPTRTPAYTPTFSPPSLTPTPTIGLGVSSDTEQGAAATQTPEPSPLPNNLPNFVE